MKTILILIFFIAVTPFTTFSYGAVAIDTKDDEGLNQTLWLENGKMRVDSGEEEGYMLFNAKTNTMYIVDPEEKKVMDMSSFLTKSSAGKNRFKMKVKKRGKGPVIAGYSTSHYAFFANGKKCTDEYLSKKALNDVGSTTIFDALSKLGQMEGLPSESVDPCDSVDGSSGDLYKKYGFPLRIVNDDGSLDLEVIKISKKRKMPKGGFDLPAGYAVEDVGNIMQKAMQNMPSMKEMPRDIDPEVMERMMKEMMKQRGR